MEDLASGLISLPQNHRDLYTSWRIETHGDGFKQISTQTEATQNTSQNTNSGGTTTNQGGETKNSEQSSSITSSESSSRSDKSNGSDLSPEEKAFLESIGASFDSIEATNPNEGKTQEQLQQELDEAQNTEFRINGT